jgi:hypothetical protein
MDARRLAALIALAGAPVLARPAPPCAIPDDPIHWVADWCMATLETDDEIAASACIAQHPVARFDSACAAKTHFKRELCRVLRGPRAPADAVKACMRDPAVMGATVRHGGVGGR